MRKKSFISMILVLIITISCVGCESGSKERVTDADLSGIATLSLWYADDTYTPYIEQVANNYHELNENVTIVPKLVGSDEYLEQIYNGSVKESNPSDLYMLSSDNLEKAYLMGLVASNDKYNATFKEAVYGKAGIDASTYDNKLLGYPLSFDTTVMVYNKKYAKSMNTFKDITDFSNKFVHTEENAGVEYIVQWDVSDVFSNYAFVGSSMNVGGSSSDDSKSVKINGNSIKASLTEYLKFKTDYGIVRKTTTAENCVKLFIQNKLLYTLVKTKDLKAINESGVDYGISRIPDLTNELKTNTISTTQLIVVNPYSKALNVSKNVAKALSYDFAGELYGLTGAVSARIDLNQNPTTEYVNLYEIYSKSIVKAQFMDIGDFYLRIEIMLHQTWDGTSIEESYDTFHKYLNTQFNVTAATTN